MPIINKKEELELKKARLLALREERKHREALRNRGDVPIEAHSVPAPSEIETEKILHDLVIQKDAKITSNVKVSQRPISQGHLAHNAKCTSRRSVKLGVSKIDECSFEPSSLEKHSKDTQTANEIPCETPSILTDTWPETPCDSNRPVSKNLMSLEWDDDLISGDEDDLMTDREIPPISNHIDTEKNVRIADIASPIQVNESIKEDKENVLSSVHFWEFLSRASAIVEDIMEEDERDIFFDYSGADEEDKLAETQHLLIEDRVFFDEVWTSRRAVTALDWSLNHPEVVLAGYSDHQRKEPALTPVSLYSAAANVDGVCLLWNIKSKKSESVPEYILTCQSSVTTAIFSDFHPNLVIAGTFVGQVFIWDTRVNRQTPIQRTGLAGNSGHWEPIKSIEVTNSQNTHNLVSVSADGRLCAWSLDMLTQPVQTLELFYKQTKPVIPSSVAFVRDFDDSFLVGAQDGFIYSGCRGGNEPGVSVQFEGHHQAPVTAIAVPCADDPLNDPNIYLTTSMDCTAKLWSRAQSLPLVSFEDRSDYILHCDWSASHPALFATVDLGGHLDIWNLNINSEEPTTSTVLNNDATPNCCKFEKKGSHIVVGDDTGRTRIFVINDKIASPRVDEWTMFEKHIHQLTEAAMREQKTDSMMRDLAFSDL